MGWRSQLDATSAARVMSGLVEDGLLQPSQSFLAKKGDIGLLMAARLFVPSEPLYGIHVLHKASWYLLVGLFEARLVLTMCSQASRIVSS